MSNFLRYNWPSVLWAILIMVACLLPGRDLPDLTWWQADKWLHAAVYFLWAVLLHHGWIRQRAYPQLHQNTLSKIIILTAVYGFALEILQELLTTDRHFDLRDVLANAAGGAAGVAFIRFTNNSRRPLPR
ncbi:MAG: VanZ family protein [Chitinophagales bacterium]|nr:VanZ family protein [Chitinophagales bacterium]